MDARSTLVSHMMKVPYLPVLPPLHGVAERIARLELKNMQPTLHKLAKLAGAQIIGPIQVAYDWCDSGAARADECAAMAHMKPAR
jgi:hypothetical protein